MEGCENPQRLSLQHPDPAPTINLETWFAHGYFIGAQQHLVSSPWLQHQLSQGGFSFHRLAPNVGRLCLCQGLFLFMLNS